ncbi:hypothetical protein [Clostridium oceanicum]|uniref:ABC-2 family transporter protein n=1 Tax=Clostridium oceanicum TaxID=1543 RepID=A0ABN1JMM9_9CLOT
MKTFNYLLKYHLSLYLKTNKFIMPMVLWMGFMAVSYSVKPQDFVSSALVSMGVLFLIMAWISFSYLEDIDIVSEELILLKSRNKTIYYLSKNVFLIIIGLFMSIIGVAFPIIRNALDRFEFFNRSITVGDIFSSLLLHIIFAALGCSLCILFQARCIKNRKIAIEMLILALVVSIIKIAIIQKLPLIKYVTWVLPPICEILKVLGDKNFFYIGDIVKSIIYGSVYIFAYNTINIHILKKRLF